jgi:glycosyltransferase involved in cell wall biosynthesis
MSTGLLPHSCDQSQMPLRVLYLHPFGVYGGATRSLVEMVGALPVGEVDGTVVTPPGVAADSCAAVGLRVIPVRGLPQWDDTRFGHYRGLRWAILLRELALLPEVVTAVRAARAAGPYDVIHCNEVTALPVALAFKTALGGHLVVHVRSLQRGAQGGRRTRTLIALLRRHADAVVAIDEAVRRTLPTDLAVDVIHNGLKDPGEPTPMAHGVYTVGIIGVLHRSKGVFELIEAARLLRDRGVNVRVLVVGENVRPVTGLKGRALKALDFASDVRAELSALVERHGLQGVVSFTGFVKDIGRIYRELDAVCFPSHLDAPGRPVFEAALYGVPAIVAMKDPTTDVVVDGVTGLCIKEPTPAAIADAIAALATAPDRAIQMGRAARAHGRERFDARQTAARTLAVYRRVVGAP